MTNLIDLKIAKLKAKGFMEMDVDVSNIQPYNLSPENVSNDVQESKKNGLLSRDHLGGSDVY